MSALNKRTPHSEDPEQRRVDVCLMPNSAEYFGTPAS